MVLSSERSTAMAVQAFPRYKLHNIPEALRAVANEVELGETQAKHCVLIIETEDGRITTRAFGPDPFLTSQAVGIITVGLHHQFLHTDDEE